MNANTNGMDRIIRVVLGVVLVALAWFYLAGLGVLWATIIGIVGVVLLITAAMSWCPIYAIFGISTRRIE